MSESTNDVEILKTTEDKFYLYLSLIVQGLGSLTLIIIAILRFINTRQNTKLNTIKNIYYRDKSQSLKLKNKIISSEDEENKKTKL